MITNRATLISIGGTGDDENSIRTYSGQKVHRFGAIGHVTVIETIVKFLIARSESCIQQEYKMINLWNCHCRVADRHNSPSCDANVGVVFQPR